MKRDKNLKFIVFKCALNSNSGLGHIKRCIIVAKLISSKFTPLFIVPDYAKSYIKIIVKNKLNFKQLPKSANLLEEVKYYPTNTCGVVIDIADNLHRSNRKLFYNYLNSLTKHKFMAVLFDGMFEDCIFTEDHPAISLIIKPYVGAEKDKIPLNTPVIGGSDYVIIGNEYINNKNFKYKNNSKRVLITLGGSDPTEVTTWILNSLKSDLNNSSDYLISVIIGPYFTHSQIEKIKSFYDIFPNIKFIYNPESLLNFYISNDIVLLGSGANSRYEAASCGKPCIGVGILKEHDHQCFLNSGKGGFNYLGFYREVRPKIFCNTIKKILLDDEKHKSLSEASRKLINGTGSRKIAKKIENTFNNYL